MQHHWNVIFHNDITRGHDFGAASCYLVCVDVFSDVVTPNLFIFSLVQCEAGSLLYTKPSERKDSVHEQKSGTISKRKLAKIIK